MQTLTIGGCLSFGWRIFKARPGIFILVPLIVLPIGLLIGFSAGIFSGFFGKALMGSVARAIMFVINVFISAGVISLYLHAHDDLPKASIENLWNPEPFWRLLGTSVLYCIIVSVGFALLIVPGLFFMSALCFSMLICIDQKKFPLASLKESMRLTKGRRWKILFLLLAIAGVNVLGAVLLVVGLFVTVPVSMLALVHAYRVLQKPEEAVLKESVPEPEKPITAPAKAMG